ncbi:hypothetical protein [Amycolatopsis samaneae]|uniref:Phage protein Gp19/Gp15/Gp42 n=1 Tax=Amycolatopsis samaneae TaxID=664691 RepID=A0ABW5GEX4_9PSEU
MTQAAEPEPLATLTQLKARPGVTITGPDAEARALTALVDASNLVRAELPPDLLSPTVPPAVVTVVCQAARRAVRNPEGYQSETAGQYTYRYGDDTTTGVYLTDAEHKVLRRVGRRSGLRSVRTPYAAEPDNAPPRTLPVLNPDGQLAEPFPWDEPPL